MRKICDVTYRLLSQRQYFVRLVQERLFINTQTVDTFKETCITKDFAVVLTS